MATENLRRKITTGNTGIYATALIRNHGLRHRHDQEYGTFHPGVATTG